MVASISISISSAPSLHLALWVFDTLAGTGIGAGTGTVLEAQDHRRWAWRALRTLGCLFNFHYLRHLCLERTALGSLRHLAGTGIGTGTGIQCWSQDHRHAGLGFTSTLGC
jgi:hypothetical protein